MPIDLGWFLSGLAIMVVGILLMRGKGTGSTVGGLLISNIGLYALLVGIVAIGINDRFAIILTTLFITAIMIIFIASGTTKILGLVLAILAGLALASVLTLLPTDSYIKTVIMAFWESVLDIGEALNPVD